ncbi:MAG TPA: hypothetical protein DCK76_04935, partial [Desulfotomaculum sp.]|nr:hypothetical protein [Desulfotomaculum sp.]
PTGSATKLQESYEQEIKRQILIEPVINCAETGARIGGKTRWLHVAGTPELTCYNIHQKRGLRRHGRHGNPSILYGNL